MIFLGKSEIVKLYKTEMVRTLTESRALGRIVAFPVAVSAGDVAKSGAVHAVDCAVSILVGLDLRASKGCVGAL